MSSASFSVGELNNSSENLILDDQDMEHDVERDMEGDIERDIERKMAEDIHCSASANDCIVSLLDSLDNFSWHPVSDEKVNQIVQELDNATCSNDPYNMAYRPYVDKYSSQFYCDNVLESEDSDENEEFEETVEELELENADEVNLLRHVRNVIARNIEMRDLLVLLKSKAEDRYRYQDLVDEDVDPEMSFEEDETYINYEIISYKFSAPYFKDEFGYPCPYNDDAKLLKKHCILPFNTKKMYQRKRWTIKDKKILCSSIKEELIEKEITRLKSNEKYLKVPINREILSLRSKSLSVLMEGKNDWEFDWDQISIKGFKGSRSSQNIALYWHNYMKPSINKGRWNNEEGQSLLNLAKQHNYQEWDTIAQKLGTNRSPFQVFVHFKVRFIEENEHNGTLSCVLRKEDATNIIECKYPSRQDEINSRRLGELIKRKKQDGNDGKIVKGRFTEEEDMLILSGIQEFDGDPVILSSLLKLRTTSQISSRYKCIKPNQTILGPWKLHEDRLLLRLVEEHGVGHWSKIAKQFITRDRTQVRHRYSVLKKQMDRGEEFKIEEVKRYQVRKEWNKSGNCDNIIKKVKKQIKACKFDLREGSCTVKIDQVNCLKRHLFLKKTKKCQRNLTMINKDLVDFFREQCNPFKTVRKLDFENITQLALNTLRSLVYVHAANLRIFTKNDVENDDRVDDLLKSVLIELMYDDVCDFKLDLVKKVVTGIIKNVDSPTSMNEELVINDYRSNSSVENIDCLAVSKIDSLIPMNDQWLFSEIDISKAGLSQIIEGRLDDFSFGVFQFIKEEDTQPISPNRISLETDDKPELPDVLSCSNKFYKLPINISSVMCLRTMELARPKLDSPLSNENKIIISDPNSQSESEHDDIPNVKCLNYTRKHLAKEYFSEKVENLRSTKIFVQRICQVSEQTSVIRELVKKKPKRSKNVMLTKKQIKETYIRELRRESKPRYVDRPAKQVSDSDNDTRESS